MSLVYGLFAPNAPNLIDPSLFGGAGKETVEALRALDVPGRVHPDAILVASPHWVSRGFRIQASARPRQIYDFAGFPRALSEVRYNPSGDPDLARAIVEEGKRSHLDVATTEEWGLDHGAWAPLIHVAPGGRVPVVPLSIAPLPPREHIAWGEAIGRALARTDKRVAFVSTGSITHRLDRIDLSSSEPWLEGARIEEEIVGRILARQYDDVASFDTEKWTTVAPEGDLAPFFMMVGALGDRFVPRLRSTGQAFGSAGLTVIEFIPA